MASGGRRWSGVAEADALEAELIALGVPREAVLRELCSLTTFENAWYSARLLSGLGAERAGIVTCDWHMHRAIASFRRAGVVGVPIPVESPPCAGIYRLMRRTKERVRWWVEIGAARP